jgi:hypothetical protein
VTSHLIGFFQNNSLVGYFSLLLSFVALFRIVRSIQSDEVFPIGVGQLSGLPPQQTDQLQKFQFDHGPRARLKSL